MFSYFSRRIIDVAVAVVYEPDLGFFLHYKPRWHGYSLPMRNQLQTDVNWDHTALEALRAATKLQLPWESALVEKLLHLEIEGVSQGIGKTTLYRYHVFQVKLRGLSLAELVPQGFACRCGFLKPEQMVPVAANFPSTAITADIRKTTSTLADLVTWSTREIVDELIGNQQVAVAVICRPGVNKKAEYLMMPNHNYGGDFLSASRCRSELAPLAQVREAIQKDTGYLPRVVVDGVPIVVEDRHHSSRFDCERRFVYHLFPVKIPEEDLADFEKVMRQLDRKWRWVSAQELDDPTANDLSPTIAVIRDALQQIA
jgi:hypothetical protein